MMAAWGTTTASFNTRTVMRTLAKAPGQSLKSLLANCALTLIVPEDESTELSTNCKRPLNLAPASGKLASTSPPPSFKADKASPKLRWGKLNETLIGSSCVIVTRLVTLACTELPAKTLITPTRPAPGATTRE